MIVRQFRRIWRRCDSGDEVRTWLEGLYLEFMNQIKNSQKADERKSETMDKIQKIKQFVDENCFDSNFSVETVADYMQLSLNYVRVIFKEKTNQSLAEYIFEKRFSRACDLLKETDHPVREIAGMVGYSTDGYFYTAFKKYSGLTPDQYRKKTRSQETEL